MEEEGGLREARAMTRYQPSSVGHQLPILRALLVQHNKSTARSSSRSPSPPRCPAVTTQSLICSGRNTAPMPCTYPSTDGKPNHVSSPYYPSSGQILSLVLHHQYSARTKKAITQPQDHHSKGEIGSIKLLQCPTHYMHTRNGCHQDAL